jgi:hypothetical protein
MPLRISEEVRDREEVDCLGGERKLVAICEFESGSSIQTMVNLPRQKKVAGSVFLVMSHVVGGKRDVVINRITSLRLQSFG